MSSAPSKETPISPTWAAHCISEAKGDDAIVVNEYSLILRYVQFKHARTCFGPPGAGGLGVGAGSAVGAKLANPDKTVIAVLGDGSYMFGNPTAAHYVLSALQLPVLFIIFNNGMWEEVEGSALRVFPDGQAARANRVPVAQLGPNPELRVSDAGLWRPWRARRPAGPACPARCSARSTPCGSRRNKR